MKLHPDLLTKARASCDVVPGNVYPAQGGRKTPGTHYWLAIAVTESIVHVIGFNDQGLPVSTASYYKHSFRERPVIGRVDVDRIELSEFRTEGTP